MKTFTQILNKKRERERMLKGFNKRIKKLRLKRGKDGSGSTEPPLILDVGICIFTATFLGCFSFLSCCIFGVHEREGGS